MPERFQITGCHGTKSANLRSILNENFKESKGNKHWLGEGVYFFVDGINAKPIEVLAAQWAIDENKEIKNCNEYVVLQADIEVLANSVFDMRSSLIKKQFNLVREKLSQVFENDKKLYKLNDNEIWKFICAEFGIFLIIADVYIKFGELRQMNIQSRMPNCTIASVKQPIQHIIKSSIKEINRGDIL